MSDSIEKVRFSCCIGSAFLATLISQVEIKEGDELICTDGNSIYINFRKFNRLAVAEQEIAFLHEIWHIARLHIFRRENRDPRLWNLACDYVISNSDQRFALYADYDDEYKNLPVYFCRRGYGGLSEEQIYLRLKEETESRHEVYEDLLYATENENASSDQMPEDNSALFEQAISKVATAREVSRQTGEDPDFYYDSFILDRFLKPKVAWQTVLRKFLRQQSNSLHRTWKKPSRRYQSVYLAGSVREKHKLDSLVYCIDVSGSISKKMASEFFSEIKYIKSMFNPRKMTVIQFDEHILREEVFTPKDEFRSVEIIKGGGTSYRDLYQYIVTEKPSCTVIFTDLDCDPMEAVNLPLVWVTTCMREVNSGIVVPYHAF